MPPFMDDWGRRLEDHDRVLLIRLGAVGDVLRTLPALHLIRTTFPSVHLAWIVEDLSRELLLDHPDIDEVLRFPRRELRAAAAHPVRAASVLAALARDLRARRFDVALDFQGSLKSGLLARLSGAPRRVGLSAGHARELSWLFTNDRVRPPARSLNRVERNLLIAEAVGARGDTIEMNLPERPEDGHAAVEALRALNPRGLPLVVLSPGTSRLQAHKRWPAEHYARLALRLASDDGVVVLVVWGPGEEEQARTIAAGSAGRAVVAPPTSLRLLAAILRRAVLFVGADTGPMHLAWSVGCTVLALFGPTDPRLNAPLGGRHVVLRSGNSTADITPDEALQAARRILASPAAASGPPRLLRSTVAPAAAEAGG
jgi:lipopolysaccharide heptosyltransferase I